MKAREQQDPPPFPKEISTAELGSAGVHIEAQIASARVQALKSDQKLEELFTAGCDPYEAAARALLGEGAHAAPQDARDLVKRVFMRVAARRAEAARATFEPTLRRAADLFHEVGSAVAAEDLLPTCKNEVLAAKLRENLRTRDQVKKITADGFELCVLALADLGAKDVTVHECGRIALGEEPWSGDDGGGDATRIPARCTGTLVHDEFTACPVHDWPRSGR